MGSELLLLPDGRLSFSVHSRGSCPQTPPRPHGDSCRTPAVISETPAALCEGRFYSPILCNTSSRLRRTSRRSAAACGTQQHLRLDSNTNCTASGSETPNVLLLVPERTNTLEKEINTTTNRPCVTSSLRLITVDEFWSLHRCLQHLFMHSSLSSAAALQRSSWSTRLLLPPPVNTEQALASPRRCSGFAPWPQSD